MQCHCTLNRSLAQRDCGRPPNAAAYAINPLPFVSFLLTFWAGFKASRQPAQQCTSVCRDVGDADERASCVISRSAPTSAGDQSDPLHLVGVNVLLVSSTKTFSACRGSRACFAVASGRLNG